MKKTRSQRTLIGRSKTPFYWLIGERTKLQRRTQLQRYIRGQINHVISAVCRGLLSHRRHIRKREDPGDEVACVDTFRSDGFLLPSPVYYFYISFTFFLARLLKMCGLPAGLPRIGPAIILQVEHFLSKVSEIYRFIMKIWFFFHVTLTPKRLTVSYNSNRMKE